MNRTRTLEIAPPRATAEREAQYHAARGSLPSQLDLSRVRVHSDDQARAATKALGATAFAHEGSIVLGPDATSSDGSPKTDILRHELVHVAQFQRAPSAHPSMVFRDAKAGKEELTKQDDVKVIRDGNFLRVVKFNGTTMIGIAEIPIPGGRRIEPGDVVVESNQDVANKGTGTSKGLTTVIDAGDTHVFLKGGLAPRMNQASGAKQRGFVRRDQDLSDEDRQDLSPREWDAIVRGEVAIDNRERIERVFSQEAFGDRKDAKTLLENLDAYSDDQLDAIVSRPDFRDLEKLAAEEEWYEAEAQRRTQAFGFYVSPQEIRDQVGEQRRMARIQSDVGSQASMVDVKEIPGQGGKRRFRAKVFTASKEVVERIYDEDGFVVDTTPSAERSGDDLLQVQIARDIRSGRIDKARAALEEEGWDADFISETMRHLSDGDLRKIALNADGKRNPKGASLIRDLNDGITGFGPFAGDIEEQRQRLVAAQNFFVTDEDRKAFEEKKAKGKARVVPVKISGLDQSHLAAEAQGNSVYVKLALHGATADHIKEHGADGVYDFLGGVTMAPNELVEVRIYENGKITSKVLPASALIGISNKIGKERLMNVATVVGTAVTFGGGSAAAGTGWLSRTSVMLDRADTVLTFADEALKTTAGSELTEGTGIKEAVSNAQTVTGFASLGLSAKDLTTASVGAVKKRLAKRRRPLKAPDVKAPNASRPIIPPARPPPALDAPAGLGKRVPLKGETIPDSKFPTPPSGVDGAASGLSARVADSSRLDVISPQQAFDELRYVREKQLLIGRPGKRSARLGDHTWYEGVGKWCRHSTKTCLDVDGNVYRNDQPLPGPAFADPSKGGMRTKEFKRSFEQHQRNIRGLEEKLATAKKELEEYRALRKGETGALAKEAGDLVRDSRRNVGKLEADLAAQRIEALKVEIKALDQDLAVLKQKGKPGYAVQDKLNEAETALGKARLDKEQALRDMDAPDGIVTAKKGTPTTVDVAGLNKPAAAKHIAKARKQGLAHAAELQSARNAPTKELAEAARTRARTLAETMAEESALAFGQQKGWTLIGNGRGRDSFDLVFENPSTREIIIIEAKGAGGELNWRWDDSGTIRVQQGTRRYLEVVGRSVAKRDPTLGTKITSALAGNRKFRYIEIRQPVDSSGKLGRLEVRDFKL
ncbi:MAG: DUF4157 domain-containing protein [Myxococcota bacterium]